MGATETTIARQLVTIILCSFHACCTFAVVVIMGLFLPGQVRSKGKGVG